MGTTEIIIAAIAVLAVVAVIVFFVTTRKHPENSDRHADEHAPPDATGRGALPGDVHERPAGPAAEGQQVDGPGNIDTGPPGPPS